MSDFRRNPFLAAALLSSAMLHFGCAGSPESSSCELAGTWELNENRIGGDCEAVSVLDAALQIEKRTNLYVIRYLAPGLPLMGCAGRPRLAECAIDLTCSGTPADLREEVAFEIEFEADRLSGTRRLQLRGPFCKATYTLEGKRRAP